MQLRRLLPLFAPLGFIACHPLACCAPGDLPKDKPLIVASTSAAAPAADVDVVLDELGVPHIFGESEPDLAYALGFLHGRDRQFQVYVYVHAGEGRLTELLGEDLLQIDRQNRLLTHRIDEQLEAMSERDAALVGGYVDGLNDGAHHTGRSAEMAVLGVEWEDLDARDVLAVMRLQQWDQSVGFSEEMARYRMAKVLDTSDPRFVELTRDTPSGGHPIVDAAAHTGAAFGFSDDRPKTSFHSAPTSTRGRTGTVPSRHLELVGGALKDVKLDIGGRFGRGGTGASNSWVVDGAHNSSGVPVLCNDPHLGHAAPGVFYMVHMEGPDFTVAGGSFPGIPGVLIGHGRHVAWGITNAFTDTQDVLVLRSSAGNPDLYELDGVPMNFTREPQRFKLGKDADSEVVKEDYLVSILGPVLPSGYGTYNGGEAWIDDDERLVLQWTAQQFPERSGGLMGAFWDLAKAKTIDEVHAAAQSFIAPSMNLAIAIAANDDGPAGIHYRLGGIVPVRGSDQRVDFPRSGAQRTSGFVGVLDADQKPQLDNPAAGFFVAANQRIVENDALSQRFVGYEAAQPFRAARIHERIAKLLGDGGQPKPTELLAIQQDVESIEARVLAPILGAHCPNSVDGYGDDVVTAFCKALGDFDGVYTIDSRAIPFARVNRALQSHVLRLHFSADLADDVIGESWVSTGFFDLIQLAEAGERVAIFDDPNTDGREDLDDAVKVAVRDALRIVAEETGTSESDWRWAKQHTLRFKGVLASAPFIGGLFETGEHEESGTGLSPRAEGASPTNRLRVSFGAGLRNFAIMSETPEVKLVNDIGQSGHFGHRHLEDQYPLWTKGDPVVLWRERDDVEKINDGLLTLTPK